jgi:hypothetical protein
LRAVVPQIDDLQRCDQVSRGSRNLGCTEQVLTRAKADYHNISAPLSRRIQVRDGFIDREAGMGKPVHQKGAASGVYEALVDGSSRGAVKEVLNTNFRDLPCLEFHNRGLNLHRNLAKRRGPGGVQISPNISTQRLCLRCRRRGGDALWDAMS